MRSGKPRPPAQPPLDPPNGANEEDLALIRDVLAGSVTHDTHPWVFDEDTLLFAVRRVEEADPYWLLEALGDPGVSFESRVAVFAETRRVRDQALTLLRRDKPTFLMPPHRPGSVGGS